MKIEIEQTEHKHNKIKKNIRKIITCSYAGA